MTRLRASLPGLAVLLWVVAIAIVYFAPAARTALRQLKHSSLPDLAVSGLPLAAVRVLAAAAIFLAAWGIGGALLRLPVARCVRAAAGLESFLAAMGLGLGVLALLALALSPLGLLRPAALLVVLAAGVALALVFLARRPLSVRLPGPGDALGKVLVGLVLAAGVWALIAALAPEVEYDAIWYHLAFPQRFLDGGSLVDERCEYVSLYPMGGELLYAYGLSFGSAVVAKLVSFGFWVLFVLATYELAARFASRRGALVAAAVAALTPTVLWEATTAYVDLAVGFFLTLSLGWMLRYAERGDTAPVVLAGLFGGFALATKTLTLIALLPLGLMALVVARTTVPRRVRHAALFGLVALLPAAPWLIRAQIEGGNPVFPSLYGVFGADGDRWTQGAADTLERSFDRWGHGEGLGGWLSLPWDLTMHASFFSGCLGVLFLMLVPVALTRRPPRQVAVLGLFVLAYLLLWASPLASQQVRFLLPVVPPLALLAALGLERGAELARTVHPRLGAALLLLVVAVLALSLPPFTGLHDRDGELTLTNVLRGAPLDVVSGAESAGEYLTRIIPAYAAARSLEPGGPVVALTDPFIDFYARAEVIPDYSACLPIAGATRGDRESELRALRRLGVRRVLVQADIRGEQGALSVTRRPLPRRLGRVAYRDKRAVVYELAPGR